MFKGAVHDGLRGHVFAEIEDVVAVIAQEYTHDVLSDVVDVALHGGEHDPVLLHRLAALFRQRGLDDLKHALSRLGSAQQEHRPDGKVNIIAALVDMDEAANASEALVESNQRFEDIVNNIPIGIGIFEGPADMSGRYHLVYASDPLCHMFGLERSQMMELVQNDQLVGLLPAEDETGGIRERLLRGETVKIRESVMLQNGKQIWLAFACRLLVRKRKSYCYVSVNDITERINSERKEIWQQERYRLISEIDDVVVFAYSPADDVMTLSKNQTGKPPVEEIHPNYLASLENRALILGFPFKKFNAEDGT